MSACAPMRDLLLEAEPEALRGLGDSALADHLRGCASCARMAERILAGTSALEAFLEDAPAAPVDAILRRAGAAYRDPVAQPGRGAPQRVRPLPTRSRRARRWLWAPAAAAAAVAVLFVALESRGPAPAAGPVWPPDAPPPVVEPADGGTVAVMQTDNPDITVLWFF